MDEFSYRHLPVIEHGRLIGVISWRDLPREERQLMQPELERHARRAHVVGASRRRHAASRHAAQRLDQLAFQHAGGSAWTAGRAREAVDVGADVQGLDRQRVPLGDTGVALTTAGSEPARPGPAAQARPNGGGALRANQRLCGGGAGDEIERQQGSG